MERKLIWALGGALIVALIAIAYLAGKMSGLETAAVAVRAEQPEHEVAPVVLAAPVVPEPEAAEREAPEREAPAREVIIENTAPAREPARRMEEPKDDNVASYFARMKAIQAGPEGADPKAFAQDLLTVTMSGDYSSFDTLLRSMERAEREAKSVDPPASCADYHRQLLAHLAEGRQMMSDLRDALARKDPEALAAIGTRASNLQSRLEALERLEARIRAGG